MFQRFTDRARKVMGLANQQAQRFNHEFIGTEHILLGIIKEGSGIAPNVLKNLGVDLKKLAAEIEKEIKRGPESVGVGQLPYTPKAKKVVELAFEEARALGHNYIGTEHLLLGLLRETESMAARVLKNSGVTIDAAREEVLALIGASSLVLAQAAAPEIALTIAACPDRGAMAVALILENKGPGGFKTSDGVTCPGNHLLLVTPGGDRVELVGGDAPGDVTIAPKGVRIWVLDLGEAPHAPRFAKPGIYRLLWTIGDTTSAVFTMLVEGKTGRA